MSEKSGFFGSDWDDSLYNPITQKTEGWWDRTYDVSDFMKYFSLFVGNGVFINPTNQLKVISNGNNTIIVKGGWAFINGGYYHNDDTDGDLILTIPENTSNSPRVDSVRIRRDEINKITKCYYFTNDTTLVRNTIFYDIQLATITVNPNSTVTDSSITDTRGNTDVCGFVKGLMEVISTKDFFLQINTLFDEWFQSVKDQVTGDLAINLQLEFNQLDTKVDGLDTLVHTFDDRLEDLEEFHGITPGDFPTKVLYDALDMPFSNMVVSNGIYDNLVNFIGGFVAFLNRGNIELRGFNLSNDLLEDYLDNYIDSNNRNEYNKWVGGFRSVNITHFNIEPITKTSIFPENNKRVNINFYDGTTLNNVYYRDLFYYTCIVSFSRHFINKHIVIPFDYGFCDKFVFDFVPINETDDLDEIESISHSTGSGIEFGQHYNNNSSQGILIPYTHYLLYNSAAIINRVKAPQMYTAAHILKKGAEYISNDYSSENWEEKNKKVTGYYKFKDPVVLAKIPENFYYKSGSVYKRVTSVSDLT